MEFTKEERLALLFQLDTTANTPTKVITALEGDHLGPHIEKIKEIYIKILKEAVKEDELTKEIYNKALREHRNGP